MDLEAMISGLTNSEKLAAMDYLWQDLSREPAKYLSPEWHERLIADRIANPASGESLSLGDARAEVQKQLDARRTQS